MGPTFLNVPVLITLCFLIQTCTVKGQGGDIGGLVNSLGDMFSGLTGVGSDCKHTCPKGQTPQPKKNHKPTSNGCGSYGIKVTVDNMPDGMTRCCNTHDICYDTCNKQRDDCDKDFSLCLSDVCHRLKTKKSTKACLDVTEIMEAGASMLGCTTYKESQKRACRCVKNTKKTNAHAKDDKKDTKPKKKPSIMMPDLSHIFDDEL